ncbi:response regulator [Rhodopseudomonas sp. BR0M22]|uniref:response regulator n=1 Tax=Rhodopseudomonas sp. BR0M22 TaxID=2269369 RepID=UPI0013DEEA52|nr:response regulator [Rhodopseudomonas sp. BR0M22]NEW94135.1 response regulator [Rhodopseudomonas sp. BR0M22]
MRSDQCPVGEHADPQADKLLGLLDLLVVDDDATQRMLIAGAAEKAGYMVTHAESCAEGTALVRVKHFDCITLDLKLEDGDGADVMRAMAAVKYDGPMIVISGMNSQHRRASRDLAKSLGMELLQSFPKPIDLAALRISLANLRSTVAGLPIVHSWGEVCGPRFERNG